MRTFNVIIKEEAEFDLFEIYNYYENAQSKLSDALQSTRVKVLGNYIKKQNPIV